MSSSTPPSPAPSETAAAQRRPVGRATAILLGLAVLPILIALVATNDSYGYLGDEFYYLACSEHLAWGYVDHPPLSILLLALSRAILVDAIWALHLLPALAVAGSVFLTGLMARRLGAGTFGQALAEGSGPQPAGHEPREKNGPSRGQNRDEAQRPHGVAEDHADQREKRDG